MIGIIKKIFVTFILCCICIVSLASCSGGIKGDDAKAYINDFFDAVSAEDYERAEALLHPDRPADLEEFFLNIEEKEDLDFQSGIEVERYTGMSSSYYDSTVDGSRYELVMQVSVDEKNVEFTIEIVQNENGYGIYNLNLDT